MKGFWRSQSHLWKQYKVRWESLKTKLFSEKVVPPQITSKRYLRFSRLTKVRINGPNPIMGVPKYHIWKTIKRSLSNIKYNFFLKRLFLPRFTSEKTVLLSRTWQKSHGHEHKPHLKTCKPLLHDTKNYFVNMLFLRKFTSKKMILHLPIQLSTCDLRVCASS